MNRRDLDTYRDLYANGGSNGSLLDIWDKITNILEESGLDCEIAEELGLHLTEWIRTTWGGVILSERHIGDPLPAKQKPQSDAETMDLITTPVAAHDPLTGSRFAALRDQAIKLISQTPPFEKGGPGGISDIALEIVQAVRRDYRGSYIPRIVKLDQLKRDREIWLSGNTCAQMEQLAQKHGISLVRAYQINRAYQQQRDRLEQPILPGV